MMKKEIAMVIWTMEKNRGCDIVPKGELDMDNSNKISLWTKINFLIYFVIGNRMRHYTTILNQKRDFNK